MNLGKPYQVVLNLKGDINGVVTPKDLQLDSASEPKFTNSIDFFRITS